jgi:hypothetical protein
MATDLQERQCMSEKSPEQTTPFGINDMLAMPRQCGYCGMIHGPKCPTVKAMEFHPNGSVKRVEFFAPNDYAESAQMPSDATQTTET